MGTIFELAVASRQTCISYSFSLLSSAQLIQIAAPISDGFLLTYMSIQDVINRHEGTELECVGSLFPGEETPRFVYVSEEVARFIWNTDSTREGHIGQNAGALIDDFIEGGHITLGMDPYGKSPACIMARVDSPDPSYEIWDMRCLDPQPGARVLGAFSEKDCFIALTWDYRGNFDGQWPEQIDRCITEWKRLFGDLPPLKGTTPDAYISEPYTAC